MERELLKFINNSLRVANQSNFYKTKGIPNHVNNAEEFADIEITTKEELRNSKPYDLLSVDIADLKEYHESSGTTGLPVAVWCTKNDIKAGGEQINESPVNFTPQDIIIMRFPYALSMPAHIFSQAINSKGGTIVPVSRGSNITPYKRVINLMKKLKANILACNPYEAIILADVAEKMGCDVKKDLNLRAICVGGEMLCEKRRKFIEERWNAEVYNFYGMTESSNIATSCKYGQLHCSKDFYLEVIDEKTNSSLGYNKKGILHITQLNKEAFPLIRYNTMDIVELRKSNCSCGNKHDILVHYGRKSDEIVVGENSCTMYEFQETLLNCNCIYEKKYWKIEVLEDKVKVYIENETDQLNNNFKLDLPFNNEVIFVKRGMLQDISSLMQDSETMGKANYFKENKLYQGVY